MTGPGEGSQEAGDHRCLVAAWAEGLTREFLGGGRPWGGRPLFVVISRSLFSHTTCFGCLAEATDPNRGCLTAPGAAKQPKMRRDRAPGTRATTERGDAGATQPVRGHAKDPFSFAGVDPDVGSHADLCVDRSHYEPSAHKEDPEPSSVARLPRVSPQLTVPIEDQTDPSIVTPRAR